MLVAFAPHVGTGGCYCLPVAASAVGCGDANSDGVESSRAGVHYPCWS